MNSEIMKPNVCLGCVWFSAILGRSTHWGRSSSMCTFCLHAVKCSLHRIQKKTDFISIGFLNVDGYLFTLSIVSSYSRLCFAVFSVVYNSLDILRPVHTRCGWFFFCSDFNDFCVNMLFMHRDKYSTLCMQMYLMR